MEDLDERLDGTGRQAGRFYNMLHRKRYMSANRLNGNAESDVAQVRNLRVCAERTQLRECFAELVRRFYATTQSFQQCTRKLSAFVKGRIQPVVLQLRDCPRDLYGFRSVEPNVRAKPC